MLPAENLELAGLIILGSSPASTPPPPEEVIWDELSFRVDEHVGRSFRNPVSSVFWNERWQKKGEPRDPRPAGTEVDAAGSKQDLLEHPGLKAATDVDPCL